jgi:hypothetical protein
MTDYTISQHATSGESYALRWDGETITGYVGPLHHTDRAGLIAGTTVLGITELDYEPIEDGDFFNRTAWQAPAMAEEA